MHFEDTPVKKPMTTTMSRSYSRLRQLSTFEDRYNYLKLGGSVGATTFGFDRYLNQDLYSSSEWKRVRREVIIRDNGCDLGIPGYEIGHDLLVHHMNPITKDDVIQHNDDIFNPEFLITTTQQTHNAIHYGNATILKKPFVERRNGDTKLW